MNEMRRRAEQLFDAALELERDARADFVTAACGSDLELCRQVLVLLAAHDRADGILDLDAATLLDPERAPERLGAYRVVRELGRGGMGIVYEAERDDGQFLRRVAIKLLRGGDDPELRQRVLAERQILASLDHPNIARLLDGGVSADGRPYLVMEHVEGLPIDVYCDRMRLTVAERLQLFVPVVRAVAYAHRNLVVHRDLKPSNILVTADGTPKLLDFGVARLLNPALGAVGSLTAHSGSGPVSGASQRTGGTGRSGGGRPARERLALTPEYASPEQLRNEMVTTQSDVYSLGVLLYELLCGRRPFHGATLTELLSAVEGADEISPSDRAGRDETVPGTHGAARAIDAAGVARARQTTPAGLVRTLRGDLDAITHLALRKEPRHRYASAELLADDVERFLDGRPVVAQRGGGVYVAGKLVRRHRAAVAAVLMAVLMILAGTGAALMQAAVARGERIRAERAQAEAQRVSEFVVDLFEAGAPERAMGQTITARDLVQRGVQRIDALQDEREVQAALLGVLGRVHGTLADYDAAQTLTERALTLYAAEGDDAGRAGMLVQLGSLQRQRGAYREARESLLQALDLQLTRPAAAASELGGTYQLLASVAVYLGDLDEALHYATEAYHSNRRSRGEHDRLTLDAQLLLGVVQRRRGERDQAERTMRAVVAARPLARGSTLAETLEDRLQLADLLVLKSERVEAERLYREIIAAAQASEPAELALRGRARQGLSRLVAERGDLGEAERLLAEVYEERRAVYGAGHPQVADAALALGGAVLRAGRPADGERLFREAADIYRETVGERHLAYTNALAQISAVYAGRGQHLVADTLLSRAYALRIAGEGPLAHGLPDLLRRRAEANIGMGRFAEAEALLTEALANARERGYSPGVSRQIHAAFEQLYTAWQRPADAARHSALAR